MQHLRIVDTCGKVLSYVRSRISHAPFQAEPPSRFEVSVTSIGLFIGSFLFHLAPFFRYGHHPLGYDTGFYRRYLIEPVVSFPNTPVPGLGDDALVPRMVFDVLRLTHLPTDILLYGSYLTLMALIPVALFLFIRRYASFRTALLASVFYIFSAVSYNTYWFFLWKNVWSLFLLICAFYALERNWLIAGYICGILIQLSHKTTAVVYLLTLAALWIFVKEKRRDLFFQGMLGGALFLLINMPSIHEASVVLPSGIFLGWSEFITYAIPCMVFVLAGILTATKSYIPRTVLCFTAVVFFYTLFHIPFYERIFVYLDLGLVMLAAYAVDHLLRQLKKNEDVRITLLIFVILCVGVGTMFGNIWNQFKMLRPLISDESIASIATIDTYVSEDATLLTTAEEAPWYEGWTHTHIAAPGLLHDFHNYEAWSAFWNSTSTEEKVAFLNSFPQPLYISTQQNIESLLGTNPPCLAEISPVLWRYNCGSTK